MRLLIAAILVASCMSARAAAESPIVAISWETRLSTPIAECLQREAPGFSSWRSSDYLPAVLDSYSFTTRQAPSTVIGDWDGDGVLDVVLYGRQGLRNRVIAVFQKKDGCRIVEIRSDEDPDPSKVPVDFGPLSGTGLTDSLSLAKPGTKRSSHEKDSLRLKTDAFVLSTFGKAAVLHYYDRNSFRTFHLAD